MKPNATTPRTDKNRMVYMFWEDTFEFLIYHIYYMCTLLWMFYVICIKRFKRFRKDGTPNLHSVQTYYIVQQQLIIQSMQIGENEAGAGFERIERGTRGPSRDNVILFHLLFLDLV